MQPAAPGAAQPPSPPHQQAPLRLLRWQSTTQAFQEALGEGEVLTMLRIPAGRFWMGSPDQEAGRDPDEGPAREVEIGEFLIASTPITQAQWRVVANWEPPPGETWQQALPLEPFLFQGEQARLFEPESDTAQRPVERVTWEEAREFCRRLSQRTSRRYSLPSEAQWEYACRAGTTSPYAFGAALTAELATLRFLTGRLDDPGATAWVTEGQQTTPVLLHPANAWGLHDMHGNVWEWCLDHWHASYSGAPADGTAWIDAQAPANTDRVVRGGAWSDPPSDARSACRYRLPPQSREPAIVGLRVVCMPGGGGGERGWDAGDQSARGASDRQACVVWIDDHHDNNLSERALLADEGIRFILADSNDEVLGLIASGSVDLVISDMSRHNDPNAGLMLLELLRSCKQNVPVIFYVGNREAEAIGQAVELGAAAVINQPAELIEAVQIELAGHKDGPVRIQRAKSK